MEYFKFNQLVTTELFRGFFISWPMESIWPMMPLWWKLDHFAYYSRQWCEWMYWKSSSLNTLMFLGNWTHPSAAAEGDGERWRSQALPDSMELFRRKTSKLHTKQKGLAENCLIWQRCEKTLCSTVFTVLCHQQASCFVTSEGCSDAATGTHMIIWMSFLKISKATDPDGKKTHSFI